MQEALINQFILTLKDDNFSSEQLAKIKTQLIVFFIDCDVVSKTHEIITVDFSSEELQMYLFSRKIEGLSERTLKQYGKCIQRMIMFTNKQAKDITTEDIRYYLYHIKSLYNLSDNTLKNYRTYINAFFQWLVDNDYILKNPCRNIKSIKTADVIKEPLSGIEMELLRNACNTKRETAVLEFLYSTACRVSELTNVRMEDIDFVQRSVKLFGKGKKERISYISDRCAVALDEYLEGLKYQPIYLFGNSKGDHGKIWPENFEEMLRELGKRANISTKVHPHRIRRTAATDAVKRGMPIEQVSKWLGHESIETTQAYVKVDVTTIKMSHSKYIT